MARGRLLGQWLERRVARARRGPRPDGMTVGRRLTLGFGALVVLPLAGSAIAGWQTRAIAAKIERVVQVVRAYEFTALNTHWSLNAYGSIVYALLVLHTVHLVTDFVDTIVLTVLMFTGPLTGRRFVDIAENAGYWWFVIGAWLPIYFTLYLVPRLFD